MSNLLTSIELKNVQKKVKIYQNEYETMSKKLLKPINSEVILEKNVKKLQERLAELEKENLRLNGLKLAPPKNMLPIISQNLEEKYREIKFLQQSIKEIEEFLENNHKESQEKHQIFLELVAKYEKLKQKAGNYVKLGPNKVFLKLTKKFEVMKTSWTNNVIKYQQKISDLEEELEELGKESMQLNAKSFKKAQQQRLLKMSYDEITERQKSKSISLRPDIEHPGVSFMYKPSVKSLYNI